MSENTSILVVSCDAYSDLWDPFFKLFKSNWPDCPYSIYLQANRKTYDREGVNIIQVGDDIDWSSNLKIALDQVPTPNVLVLLEDFFLCQSVDTQKVKALESFMLERNAAYLRLVPKPPPNSLLDSDLGIGEISKGTMYRVSFQASIWDKGVLKDLLSVGENAWAAEMAGSQRSDRLSREFLSVDKTPHSEWPLHYMNAVIKKKWTPEAALFCQNNNIPLDLEKRPICNGYDQLRRKHFFRKTVSAMIVIVRSLLGKRLYASFKNNKLLRRLIY